MQTKRTKKRHLIAALRSALKALERRVELLEARPVFSFPLPPTPTVSVPNIPLVVETPPPTTWDGPMWACDDSTKFVVELHKGTGLGR